MMLLTWERLMKRTNPTSLSLEKQLCALGPLDSEDAEKRIDLVEFVDSGNCILADVSITHPIVTNLSAQKSHASNNGVAAKEREKEGGEIPKTLRQAWDEIHSPCL